MTTHPHDLEALVLGELAAGAAAAAREHVASCPTCRREHDWLLAERRLVTARRRDDRAELQALWGAVEREIGGPAPARIGRRALAVAAGVGAALAAAAVLLLVWPRTDLQVRSLPLAAAPQGGGPAAATSGDDVAPGATDRGGLGEAERAVADAERSYDRALDLLEGDYQARRARLPGAQAASYDQSFRDSRRELREARASAGDDLDARVLVLDLYAHQVRSLRGAVHALR